MSAAPAIEAFFDEPTFTITYLVSDPATGRAAIVDPVRDYDHKSGKASTRSADRVLDKARERGLTVDWILETHAHADHLSAAPYLKGKLGGRTGIGEQIRTVQKVFKGIFNLEPQFRQDGSQFDHLFADGERFSIGNLSGHVMHVPGHPPADVAYVNGAAVFEGDTLFMRDVGTARCDFPGGNAHMLYGSVRKILSLPAETRLFMCHDYPPNGRAVAYESTVAEQRAKNIHVHDGITEAQFVEMRTKRDATLDMPVLILPAVQINIRAGELPPKEGNGVSYVKIPINAL
jgi:glyoxylase-like metal-dependent hydrolase (beta-lactamase superfamily II)